MAAAAAAATPSPADLNGVLHRYYPSAAGSLPAVSSSSDKKELAETSRAVYGNEITYTDAEQAEMAQWAGRAATLASEAHGSAGLKELNAHLASRTTILGAKPSVADAALYAALAPLVHKWTAEQRTGEAGGLHHVVRYVDFVQSAPLMKLAVPEAERVAINPDEVLFVPKAVDPKAEKERKKKEKAAAAAAASGSAAAAVGAAKELPARGKQSEGAGGILQQAKEAAGHAVDAVKAKGAEVAAAAGAAVAGAQEQQQQKKKEKKEKKPKQPAAPAAPEKPLGPNLIDLRVGHILKCERHPNADSLYVSTIDVGDAEGTKDTWLHEESGKIVRTVCSGLNGLVPLEAMQDRRIVAVCNLKPVKMRGITSSAMVLAASPRLAPGEEDTHAGPVELVEVPAGAAAGTRVNFEGFEGDPEAQLNPKKKVWEAMQPGFTTLAADGAVAFERNSTEALAGDKAGGKPDVARLVVVGAGPCTVPTLRNAVVR